MTHTHSVTETLNDLIKITKDGQEGFRNASENVRDHALKAVLSKYSLQRAKFAGELQQLVIGLGEEEAKESDLLGALHRGWINLKAAITKGDDHAILAECERGEDVAKDAYKHALENDDLPRNIRDTITAQSIEVQTAHDDIKSRRDASR